MKTYYTAIKSGALRNQMPANKVNHSFLHHWTTSNHYTRPEKTYKLAFSTTALHHIETWNSGAHRYEEIWTSYPKGLDDKIKEWLLTTSRTNIHHILNNNWKLPISNGEQNKWENSQKWGPSNKRIAQYPCYKWKLWYTTLSCSITCLVVTLWPPHTEGKIWHTQNDKLTSLSPSFK